MTSTARPRSGGSEKELNAELIGLLFGMLDKLRAHFDRAAAGAGLHGGRARAIATLDGPTPMRQLAAAMACDPSNVTGIVDDLERRGLVTREADPHDRRVKLLVLTKEGQRQRRDFLDRLHSTVPGISALSPAQQRELRDLLARAVTP